MARTDKLYRPLPGRGLSSFQNVRLYQGPDHILQTASTGYTETYKRFYLRDIQAIIIQKSFWGKLFNGFWGFLAVAFALPGFDASGAAAFLMWSVGGFFGFCLLVNITLGPTCRCYIRTAVQTERLSAVTRISTARRLLKVLRRLIAAAQGSLPREEMLTQMRGFGSNIEAPPGTAETSTEISAIDARQKAAGPA